MEDKFSKGGKYKRLKNGSKREHGNFVHPPFKISGSAPAIRDWNVLPDSLISSAEDAEDCVAKFTSLVRARD